MMSCLSHPLLWWVAICAVVGLFVLVILGVGYLLGLERQPQGRKR